MSVETPKPIQAPRRKLFIFSRLGSLLALLPLGVWTFVHVWDNLAAFESPAAWEAAVTEYAHPASQMAAAVISVLPLAIHTFWGIGRLRTSRPNNIPYGYYSNWKYLLQRASAIGVLLFVGAHMWLAWIHPRMTLGRGEPFEDIAYQMRFHTPTLVVYLLGTLGVAYHLANGIQGFAMGWGIAVSRKGLRRIEWISIALFVVLLAMSWAAIYALWQAGAHVTHANR
jgi:succinate dehydrogenase / fumarate reductase cytochrome b subunit